jgi:Zn-finger protein
MGVMVVGDNYKFFQHRRCEYFPCHRVKEENAFNCLFCYCPLYLLEDCGGNNVFNDGIKNCTDCTIPHLEKGYDYIINKIIERNKAIKK